MTVKGRKILKWIGMGAIAIAILFVVRVFVVFYAGLFPGLTFSVLRGVVVGTEEGEPIANATVWTSSTGGSFLSTQTFNDSTRSDRRGAFFLVRRTWGEPDVHARAPGFAPFDLRNAYSKGSTITVRMAKLSPDHESVRRGTLRVSASDHGIWQWCYLKPPYAAVDSSGGSDSGASQLHGFEGADFSILVRELPKPTIEIRCWGNGGVVLADTTSDEYGQGQLVTHSCLAPESGYVKSLTFYPESDWQMGFLRSADGKYYARIAFTVRAATRIGLDHELMKLQLPIWYNEAGSRGTCSAN